MAVQLVGSITDVTALSIFEQHTDFLIVVVVGVVSQHPRIDKVSALLLSDVVKQLGLSLQRFYHLLREGFVRNPDSTQMAVNQMLRKHPQHFVVVFNPQFYSHINIAVVNQGKTVQNLTLLFKIIKGIMM